MSSVPSTDSGIVLTRGINGVKRSLRSSVGIPLPPDSHGGTIMSVIPLPNDAGEDMVCDNPSTPLRMVNEITEIQAAESNATDKKYILQFFLKGNFNDDIYFTPSNEEDISFPRTSSSDGFLSTSKKRQIAFALFLLNPDAGGGPENTNIPDKVKLNCLSKLVQVHQQQIKKDTQATSLELLKLKEAHEAEMVQLFFDYEEVNAFHSKYEAKIRKLICHVEEHEDTKCQIRDVDDTFQLEWEPGKKKAKKMIVELIEKTAKSPKNMSQGVKTRGMTAKKVESELKLLLNQEAAKASNEEVKQLKSIIEEKEKALRELKLETNQLISKCEEMEAQLAQIEQKAAQESLTCGSYSDDHANPSMLEDVCKNVDKATENLIRALHRGSITSKHSAEWEDQLERFVCLISPARMANFSRPVQRKYAWGHWICCRMFHDFEHVFFDADDMSLTSPLDSKIHALECFQSFQQKKHMPSVKLYEECDRFRAFCYKKYLYVFPAAIRKMALHTHLRSKVLCGSYGRGNHDSKEVSYLFLDVAKAIWLLHELSLSFDPPASIVRMAARLPFDNQYHEPVIHDMDNDGLPQVVLLMIRPAFRLRNTIIRSRVFLSTSGRVDSSETPDETTRR